jgi:pyruvate/2-oxoglutarate dehydrogenase complex dihydrolipoamide dehydrogenase (E3) component
MAGSLIQREDEDVSSAIKEIMEQEGIHIRLNAECIGFSKRGPDIIARVECATGAPEVSGTHILLAVGRRANTDDLGLEKAGVSVDKRGYIVVDDQLRTSAPGIWALGDCNGKGAFTHTSFNDAEIVAANLLDSDPRRVSDRILAYALYIDPPLGRAGLTETEVRKDGRSALIGKRPMTRVGRAVEKGETQGFMKIIVDAQTREILGAAILGTGGDEVIHSILDVMYAKAAIQSFNGRCTFTRRFRSSSRPCSASFNLSPGHPARVLLPSGCRRLSKNFELSAVSPKASLRAALLSFMRGLVY